MKVLFITFFVENCVKTVDSTAGSFWRLCFVVLLNRIVIPEGVSIIIFHINEERLNLSLHKVL